MKISAIVCTSNRPASLAKLLRALLGQERRPEQIVIVEDREGPEPSETLQALRARGIEVCYLRRSGPSLTASRNLALSHAGGDLLSFFDDDTIPDDDYFAVVGQVFAADSSGRLGGLAPVIEPWDHRPGPGDRLWQLLMRIAGLWSLPYRPRRPIFSRRTCFRFGLTPAPFLPGVVSYRRASLACTSFDPNLDGYGLGEDLDLSFSLPACWGLYRCTSLTIRHQRDPLHRPRPLLMGKMLVRNLLYITCKHAGFRMGTIIVLLWQIMGLCWAHLLFVFFGNRPSHLASLAGITLSLPAAWRYLCSVRHSFAKAPTVSAEFSALRSPAKKRKHILFVLNTLAVGGAERLTLTLVQSLDPRRFGASLLCLQDPGPLAEELPEHVEFYHNFTRQKFDISVLPAMVRLVTGRHIDLLVSVGNGGDRTFWSSLTCLLTARPLVVWCHSQPTAQSPSFERLNRLLRTVTHTFVAVSRSQARALSQVLHLPPSRIKIIENSLPAPFAAYQARPTAQQRASFRKKLNLPADAFLIVNVAGFRAVKGHDVLIDAASEVLSHCSSAYFLLIGEGGRQQAIRRRIADRRIDPARVVFLGRRLDLDRLLACCDLFVLSSHSESFGLAVLEAMAAGLCVIATDTPGSRSLIDPGRTGLLTPVGRPERLGRAIIDLQTDPQRRAQIAERGRLFACQRRFHPRTMAASFEKLFQLLI